MWLKVLQEINDGFTILRLGSCNVKVRQGQNLSTILFVLAFRIQLSEIGRKINLHCCSISGYYGIFFLKNVLFNFFKYFLRFFSFFWFQFSPLFYFLLHGLLSSCLNKKTKVKYFFQIFKLVQRKATRSITEIINKDRHVNVNNKKQKR